MLTVALVVLEALQARYPAAMANKRNNNTVRIIGGRWRSRRLPVADVPGLRPSGDRTRETLFNWLAPHVPGARVRDAFAGSGALGLEALSRGAQHAVLVEQHPVCVAALQENVALLGAQAEVVRADVRQWLRRSPASVPFDVVFLDPPFADDDIEQLCTLLVERAWLAPGALVYIEQPDAASAKMPAALQLSKSRTVGKVSIALYEWSRTGADE